MSHRQSSLEKWKKEKKVVRPNEEECPKGEDQVISVLAVRDKIENVSAWSVQEFMSPCIKVMRTQEFEGKQEPVKKKESSLAFSLYDH